MEKIADDTLRVGVIGTGAGESRDGVTTADLAAIHEFGTRDGHIPERSFIRSTTAAKQPEIKALFRKGLEAVVKGKATPDKVLNVVGAFIAAEIKKTVTTGAGVSPALADSTIAAKGSDRPLVDTGRLINAVSYAIEKGGG
jgi:hypothetical protein